jgi:predicted ATPase
MIHLRATAYHPPKNITRFPFNIPVVKNMDTLTFTHEVTFFVGENGSGKSTILEAIAAAVNLPAVGSEHIERDNTLSTARLLANQLKLTWNKRTHQGFFMRSEDFFGFVKRIAMMRAEMQAELKDIDAEYPNERARLLARQPYMRELNDMQEKYGDDFDAQSHGESYFSLFKARLVSEGLYLLDEPEAALSPMRQLALLSVIKDMVKKNAQFIIATHSPILLAYPNATIFSYDDDRISPTLYETLEHVVVMRDFLLNKETYLRHLMD